MPDKLGFPHIWFLLFKGISDKYLTLTDPCLSQTNSCAHQAGLGSSGILEFISMATREDLAPGRRWVHGSTGPRDVMQENIRCFIHFKNQNSKFSLSAIFLGCLVETTPT